MQFFLAETKSLTVRLIFLLNYSSSLKTLNEKWVIKSYGEACQVNKTGNVNFFVMEYICNFHVDQHKSVHQMNLG